MTQHNAGEREAMSLRQSIMGYFITKCDEGYVSHRTRAQRKSGWVTIRLMRR